MSLGNELSLSKHEKKMLIELISNEQIHMIIKDIHVMILINIKN